MRDSIAARFAWGLWALSVLLSAGSMVFAILKMQPAQVALWLREPEVKR